MLSKLDVTNGIAGFLLANGALIADSEEFKIRKSLIENDKVEVIIVLPREMFYSTDISLTLWLELSKFYEIEIPRPSLEQQYAVVNFYNALQLIKRNIIRLNNMIKEICPILIKGALEEAQP